MDDRLQRQINDLMRRTNNLENLESKNQQRQINDIHATIRNLETRIDSLYNRFDLLEDNR